jgi:hypothetical protein
MFQGLTNIFFSVKEKEKNTLSKQIRTQEYNMFDAVFWQKVVLFLTTQTKTIRPRYYAISHPLKIDPPT